MITIFFFDIETSQYIAEHEDELEQWYRLWLFYDKINDANTWPMASAAE